ncbi:hypothetical protein Hypma_013495 [Hypsizygus marmoreus]|uniref:Uncharacterized protein n=1 Tax=Hypsizygus marmoreus TaxID=39966 RepID=A0A369JD28_HYPMA|nr:hypothetical protein Hypma_013495 [Hypsizygus marmoreus]
MDIITSSLKSAERDGVAMVDSDGNFRLVHTPLASWIADYQEQLLIACVPSKQSPVTQALSKQFGDVRLHRAYPTRPGETLEIFWKTCQALDLSGVHQPAWRNWGKHVHRSFSLMMLSTGSINFSLITSCNGQSISWVAMSSTSTNGLAAPCWCPPLGSGNFHVKQVTGREHRELERVFVATIAGAIPDYAHRGMRALMDAIFIAQNLPFYEDTIYGFTEALREFHFYKSEIIATGGR